MDGVCLGWVWAMLVLCYYLRIGTGIYSTCIRTHAHTSSVHPGTDTKTESRKRKESQASHYMYRIQFSAHRISQRMGAVVLAWCLVLGAWCLGEDLGLEGSVDFGSKDCTAYVCVLAT